MSKRVQIDLETGYQIVDLYYSTYRLNDIGQKLGFKYWKIIDYLKSVGVQLDHNFNRKLLPAEAAADFLSYVDKSLHSEGCWTWTGSLNKDGYGLYRRFYHDGAKQLYSHRISYLIHRGSIPESLQVLHSCDNPPCVNTEHLRLGTIQDNIKDRTDRGRGRNGSKKGTKT